MEGDSIDVTFTAQLETNETLVEINITEYEATPGVNVEGNHLYGVYESVFGFADDALKYRLDDEFKTVDVKIFNCSHVFFSFSFLAYCHLSASGLLRVHIDRNKIPVQITLQCT